jgi:hypothetical protein
MNEEMTANELRAAISEVVGELVTVQIVDGQPVVPLKELAMIVEDISAVVAYNGVTLIGTGTEAEVESHGQVKIALLYADLIDLLFVKATTAAL